MNKHWKTIKWLLGTLAMFGALLLFNVLRGDPITLRSYVVATCVTVFLATNNLSLKWAIKQQFTFNFCYIFLSIPAIFFYFGDPFTLIDYIFGPLVLALIMATLFLIQRRGQAKP